MKLYENEISCATSRVRIAVEMLPIGILGVDAENRRAGYLKINPQGLVPSRFFLPASIAGISLPLGEMMLAIDLNLDARHHNAAT